MVDVECWPVFQINDLPKPSFWNETIKELGIGTYDSVITVSYHGYLRQRHHRTLPWLLKTASSLYVTMVT